MFYQITYSIGIPTLTSGFQYIVPPDPNFNFLVQSNNQFRSNDGASVVRLNDRVLIGAAANNDAAKPNVDKDWLSDSIVWPVYNATLSAVSKYGTIAISAGSRTSDLDPVEANSRETSIGVAAFGIADNQGTYPDDFYATYGFYGEGILYPNTVSNAFGAELEAINRTTVGNETPTPYRELFTASVQALRLGSGGGQASLGPMSTALSAIGIVPNGNTFNAGIIFEKGSLTGADGNTGFATAIGMAKGHMLSWYAPGSSGYGVRTAFITSTVSDETYKVSIQAQDGGWLFIQPNDTIGVSIETVANSDNGISLSPSIISETPKIKSIGSGSNVPLGLQPKGTATIVPYASIEPDASVSTALKLLDTQNIIWYNSYGHQSAALTNERTANNIFTFQFDNTGLIFYSNTIQASILEVSDAVNFPQLVPGSNNTAAGLYAQGSGNNNNLALYARDGGKLEIKSTTQNTASAIVKYLQITLNDGVTTNNYVIPLYGV